MSLTLPRRTEVYQRGFVCLSTRFCLFINEVLSVYQRGFVCLSTRF
ncbi:plasmid replication initiation protein, partial [Levilactobacillus brevis]